ncbi:MAG: transposase [Gemmatimonadota bacterium]
MPPRTRLSTHDYTRPGWYFVTTTTAGRRPLFGNLTDAGIRLNRKGEIVIAEWESTLRGRGWISCAGSVLMPDHFHALVGWKVAPVNRHADLSGLMSSFKGHSTKRLRKAGLLRSWDVVWHRGYWDQVIRHQRHYDRVLAYIESNPLRAWHRRELESVRRPRSFE